MEPITIPMTGGRITTDEKATVSTYIGIAILAVLVVGGLYLFLVQRERTKAFTGFDPNRPVPTDEVLKDHLRTEQYFVVREGGTQIPFQNEFWNNDRVGLYADVITGEPLFTSLDKYDAGIGMVTFSKPISKDSLVEKLDTSHDMQRTEISAKHSRAHLGHLFPDPKSPTGQRYATNSAAFHFVPFEEMGAKGYKSYLSLFDKK